MPLLNFTIHITTNAAVVILGVCASMCYIAWTGLRRAKLHQQAAGEPFTPAGEKTPRSERHR